MTVVKFIIADNMDNNCHSEKNCENLVWELNSYIHRGP